MAEGSLRIIVTDLAGDPVVGNVKVNLTRAEGGQHGIQWTGEFTLSGGDVVAEMEDIDCSAGATTMFNAEVVTRNFRRFRFFQGIKPDRLVNGSANPLGLAARPSRVEGIRAPAFSRLMKAERDFLDTAAMRAPEAEDRDLLDLSGRELYGRLGYLRQACLLNIFTKSRHETTDNCFRYVQAPLVIRQDRCFCRVDSDMDDFLNDSPRFDNVSGALHDPLEGYEMLEPSYKSRDEHANIQVTLMQHTDTQELAADIDIDEARGLQHGFEVLRNKIGKRRTNPYLVRELLLAGDPLRRSLDPKYRFVFKH